MAKISSVKVESHADEFIKDLDSKIEKALEECGLVAEGYAKAICPVDTGRLRNSITHDYKDNEQACYVGTNVEYGKFVELGTSRSRKQPYLKPAIENHTDKYKKIIESTLKN